MASDTSHTLFKQSFPAEFASLPRIKSDLLDVAQRAGWSGDNLGRLELVLEEGALNIINYAYPDGIGEIGITVAAVGGGLLLRLEDSGIPFDPFSAPLPDLGAAAEDRPVGGLGVYLMKSIADGMEYRREGEKNVLDITLKLK